MELTARPLINAGFALTLAAAGVIAAPVVAPLPGLPDMQTRDVQLVDVTWDQVLQTALANATDIYDHFSPAPFADLQQFAANLPDYLDGTRNFDTDLTAAGNAAIIPFIAPTGAEPYIYTSVDPTQSQIDISAIGHRIFSTSTSAGQRRSHRHPDQRAQLRHWDLPRLLCTDVTIPGSSAPRRRPAGLRNHAVPRVLGIAAERHPVGWLRHHIRPATAARRRHHRHRRRPQRLQPRLHDSLRRIAQHAGQYHQRLPQRLRRHQPRHC